MAQKLTVTANSNFHRRFIDRLLPHEELDRKSVV